MHVRQINGKKAVTVVENEFVDAYASAKIELETRASFENSKRSQNCSNLGSYFTLLEKWDVMKLRSLYSGYSLLCTFCRNFLQKKIFLILKLPFPTCKVEA